MQYNDSWFELGTGERGWMVWFSWYPAFDQPKVKITVNINYDENLVVDEGLSSEQKSSTFSLHVSSEWLSIGFFFQTLREYDD